MKIVVSNSSPLIILAKCGLLSLLKQLFGTIIISETVFREIVIQGEGKPGAKEIREANWVRPAKIGNKNILESYTKILDPDDATVIALAKEKKADLLIVDDEEIRKIAEKGKIPITGTAGIFVQAKREGLIPSVKEALDKAIQNGLMISERVIKDALREAEE